MKTEYSLIKITTELPFPYNKEKLFVGGSCGTLIRYKKECVFVHYIGLAPVFRRFLELNPNFEGKKTLLAVEENLTTFMLRKKKS